MLDRNRRGDQDGVMWGISRDRRNRGGGGLSGIHPMNVGHKLGEMVGDVTERVR
jgi:hypothetical protein